MSDQMRQPTEAELQAAYEEQLRQLRVEDVVVQTVVSLLNLGARKAGLAGGAPDEADPEQVRLAVEASRALLPLVEPALGPDGATLRDAMSQLQLAYVRMGGQEPAPEAGGEAGEGGAAGPQGAQGGGAGPGGGTTGAPGAGSGPAQRSGRLWVPGQ